MKFGMEYFCDFCHDRVRTWRGYTGVKLPVFYPSMSDRTADAVVDEENLEGALSGVEACGALGYHEYDVCEECIKKIVTLQVIPVPYREPYSYPREIHAVGNRKTVFKSDVKNGITQEAIKAFIENEKHVCETCKFRHNTGFTMLCLFGKQPVEKALPFFTYVDGKCCKWQYDDHMGYSEFENREEHEPTMYEIMSDEWDWANGKGED